MHRRSMLGLFAAFVAFAPQLVIASGAADESDKAPAAVAVQRANPPYPVIRDETAMVLVGTALIGIAAALRRAA